MRLFTYEGVEYRLSERNWERLLNRFDARRARPGVFGYFNIHVGSICEGRHYKCTRCPLCDSNRKTNGCVRLWRRVMGEELFPYVHLFDSVVIWDPEFDAEARRALRKVREILSAAVRV